MNLSYDYKRSAILFVDDEEQAVKYFDKAYRKDFRILTASSVEEAWRVVEEQGDDIGVLITDQRMPGGSGVDLLGRVRRARPDIVRILTTAYSDLDSAIAGVNSGAIYQYVTKPWNVLDLRGALRRAMEFYLIQKERDLLLREKLSVLQRIMIADRVRSLAVLAGGLAHHIRNSTTALTWFLDLAPKQLQGDQFTDEGLHQDLWELAREENRRLLKIVQQVADTTVEPNPVFKDEVDLPDVLTTCVERVCEQLSLGRDDVKLDLDSGLPRCNSDAQMLTRMFQLLLARMLRTKSIGNITVECSSRESVWGTPGVCVRMLGDGEPWSDDLIASFFTLFVPAEDDPSTVGIDLLSAFCIAHHHGGDIQVLREGQTGPGFEIQLPFDPDAVQRPALADNCLERLFQHFEEWDRVRVDSRGEG